MVELEYASVTSVELVIDRIIQFASFNMKAL